MQKNKTLFCLIFLLPLLGLSQSYYFANYGVKDGLAQSNVSGIAQDSAGFYWFSTAGGGASKFDGKNFVNYSVENGLAENNISCIYKDKKNYLWFGHDNGTLTRYNGKIFEEIKSNLLPKDKKVFSFYEDHLGQLWIGTESGGAIKVSNPRDNDLDKLSFEAYTSKEGLSQMVLDIFEDLDNQVWFLTDIGVKIYNRKSNTFNFFRPEGMPLGQVSSLSITKDHEILIGTINGNLSKYNTKDKTIKILINPADIYKLTKGMGPATIWAIFQDSKNNIWLSLSNLGVLEFNQNDSTLKLFNSSNGLSLNKIRCIYEDHEGSILFGTQGEGVDVYSGERFVSFSKKDGLNDNQVWSICEDANKHYWFATNEGINIYYPEENRYESITTEQGLTNNNVRTIIKDRSNNLWIGTWGGKVLKYDFEKKKIISLPILNDIVNNLVSSLLIDKNNKLWIGTYEGIVQFDLSTQIVKTYRTIDGLSGNDISCLFEQSNGNIWIGTNQKSVTVFDGKKFIKYNRTNGLNYGNISSFAEDNQKRVWIGTEGGGVFLFDNNSFTNLKTKDGLLSDFITLLQRDKEGNIWLGSNKGLTKINPATKKTISYLKYDGFTGLETKSRASFEDSQKDIWFGTVNGAYKYQLHADKVNKNPPLLRILEYKINLNDVELKKQQSLSYKENNFSFHFVGIALSNPEGVTYQYKLIGFDNDWKATTKDDEVVYSNLSPGTYTFVIKTCNGSGFCTDPITVTSIDIQPPYWKRWWFYLIVFIIVASILLSYIKIRERKLLQEKKILEDKVNERTAEVVKQKHLIEEKHREITDSINYAERIQRSFMATSGLLDKHLKNYFVFFQPKDVVSGDFYCASELSNGNFALVTADSTGHGVPGAIMSILNISCLENAMKAGLNEPAEIFNHTRHNIIDRLKKDGSPEGGKDGMDATLLSFDFKNSKITFAGANNPVWIVRNQELIELDPVKMPVGKHEKDSQSFTQQEIVIEKGDMIYSLTDGFPDQFGGPKGKKFMHKKLKELLVTIAAQSMQEQKELLTNRFSEWKGDSEQVDDVTLIGVRI